VATTNFFHCNRFPPANVPSFFFVVSVHMGWFCAQFWPSKPFFPRHRGQGGKTHFFGCLSSPLDSPPPPFPFFCTAFFFFCPLVTKAYAFRESLAQITFPLFPSCFCPFCFGPIRAALVHSLFSFAPLFFFFLRYPPVCIPVFCAIPRDSFFFMDCHLSFAFPSAPLFFFFPPAFSYSVLPVPTPLNTNFLSQ